MMKNFWDLDVWKSAHQLTLTTYQATKDFPREEVFGLTAQLRRSVASIEANIAEGHGRFSDREFHQFCNIARGSLAETQCHLMVARDLGYLPADDWKVLHGHSLATLRLLNGLMRALRIDPPGAGSREPGAPHQNTRSANTGCSGT